VSVAERQGQAELLGGTIHLLRNAVFTLSATIDALETHDEQPLAGCLEHVDVMRDALSSLTELASDLDTLCGPALPPSVTSFAVADWLRRLVAVARELAVRRTVTLVESCGADVGSWRGDAEALADASIRLIVYGVLRTPAGGCVRVSVERVAHAGRDVLRLTSTDGGLALEPNELARVFLPFARLPGPRPALRLAVADLVCRRNGGVARAESASGGVCLTLELLGEAG